MSSRSDGRELLGKGAQLLSKLTALNKLHSKWDPDQIALAAIKGFDIVDEHAVVYYQVRVWVEAWKSQDITLLAHLVGWIVDSINLLAHPQFEPKFSDRRERLRIRKALACARRFGVFGGPSIPEEALTIDKTINFYSKLLAAVTLSRSDVESTRRTLESAPPPKVPRRRATGRRRGRPEPNIQSLQEDARIADVQRRTNSYEETARALGKTVDEVRRAMERFRKRMNPRKRKR